MKINLDVMGMIIKNKHELWFEYVLPVVTSMQDKLRQTSLRFNVEKEAKKLGVSNKLSIINNSK